MSDNVTWIDAVETVQKSQASFFKFISANDSGETGGHQSGFLMPKNVISEMFGRIGVRGENFTEEIRIEWQDGYVTDSCFKYYGISTRNEYRLTRFGREFDFSNRISTGDVLVLSKVKDLYFKAFVLKTEDEIDNFLNAFGLSPVDSGSIISSLQKYVEPNEEDEFEKFFNSLAGNFPTTDLMSEMARLIDLKINNRELEINTNPDKKLLDWTASEYRLFRFIENRLHLSQVNAGFSNLDDFINMANTILNRRKSRAGKSLEHHLSFIFSKNKLQFSEQMITEGRSRPDFVFPSIDAYHNNTFPNQGVFVLAAKTTCKDRWRQILNEAKNIDRHYLFTLQQGISSNQLDEMIDSQVQLVVPKLHLDTFASSYRDKILTLTDFISLVSQSGK